MDKITYWKNFNLGVELEIAANFIYNSLRTYHELHNLYYAQEIFEVLYGLAVGIERIAKIAIILIEHNPEINQSDFDESLITHSHQHLIERIQKQRDLKLSTPCNELVQLLTQFYKTQRYERYNTSSISAVGGEKLAFHKFMAHNLNITIEDNYPYQITENSARMKRFLGRTVKNIVLPLYKIVSNQATALGIYTSELRYFTKAYKLFLMESFDFFDEDILKKEILLYFLANQDCSRVKLLKKLTPVPFDVGDGFDHINALLKTNGELTVMDELESHYEDISDKKMRFEIINAVSDESVILEEEDE